MNMGIDDFRDAAREKVPHDNSPIIATNRQQGTSSVKRTGHRNTDAIQRPIEILFATNKASVSLTIIAHTQNMTFTPNAHLH